MSDESASNEVPVFPVPPGVPLFSADDIASMCAFGDLRFDKAKRLTEEYRRQGMLHVGKVGPSRKFFYAPAEVAIFKLLTELDDCGMCDAALQAAALAMRTWSPDNPAPAKASGAPVWQAMFECWQGAVWGLSVQCWRSDQGGPRHFVAFCHPVSQNPRPSYLTDDYQPHLYASIVLGRILNPLHSRMMTLVRSRGVIAGEG